MERKEAIRSAYHMTGSNSFYDGMMTCSTLPGRAVCRLVWDMNRQDCVRYQEKAVSGIPEDFSGRLLEVPVGTGILTMPFYQMLPKAEITCLDYSPDMMAQAKEKADRLGLQNVSFRQLRKVPGPAPGGKTPQDGWGGPLQARPAPGG